MTYDHNNPNNPARSFPRGPNRNRGIGGGVIAAMAIAALVIGALIYINRDDRSASTTSSSSTTTGQTHTPLAPEPTALPPKAK